MGFFVCQAIPQRRARVHRAGCPYCRSGQGRWSAHPPLTTTAWSQKFENFIDARTYMLEHFSDYRDVGACERCRPDLGDSPSDTLT